MPPKARTRGDLGKLISALSLLLLILSPSILGHGAAHTSAASRGTALAALPAAAPGGTLQDFDVPSTGTPYAVGVHLPPPAPAPAVIDGGPSGTGKMLRL